MRSEKEIKEEIRNLRKDNLVLEGFQAGGLEWALEGESRYSVTEIEKIWKSEIFREKALFCEGCNMPFGQEFIDFIGAKARVEEILNE